MKSGFIELIQINKKKQAFVRSENFEKIVKEELFIKQVTNRHEIKKVCRDMTQRKKINELQ